jgi:hypothetical protein
MSTSTERMRRLRERRKRQAWGGFDGRSRREIRLDQLAERLRQRLERKRMYGE